MKMRAPHILSTIVFVCFHALSVIRADETAFHSEGDTCLGQATVESHFVAQEGACDLCESPCRCPDHNHSCLACWIDGNTLLPEDNFVDHVFDRALGVRKKLHVPVNAAGWHWWSVDTTGSGQGGYGLRDFRGTYAYSLSAAPEYDLGNGNTIGASVLFAGRDDDFYRTYYSRLFWFLSGYAYVRNDHLGTFKAGLIDTRFGLDNYLGFIGTAPYFDGFIQDPDYGFSWERTGQISDCLAVETIAQFFTHDGEWNGSLRNHDQESVAGIHERNTFVGRVTPKWTIDDDTSLRLGASALVGEIDSRLPAFATDARAVWGLHTEYVDGPLELRGEVLQWFGKSVPTRFASGGPSNRVTSFTTEAGYTIGPVKYRGQYSASFDANPSGSQHIWSAGGVIKVTPHVTLFAEFAEWTVDGHATLGSFTVLEGVQFTLLWQY